MAIEDALHRIHSCGFRVNNLFQLSSGKWQSNLRSPDGRSHEWGVSETPEGALHVAMAKCKGERTWFGLCQAVDRLAEALEAQCR